VTDENRASKGADLAKKAFFLGGGFQNCGYRSRRSGKIIELNGQMAFGKRESCDGKT